MLRAAPRSVPAALAAEDELTAILRCCAARDPAALDLLEQRCGERLRVVLTRTGGDAGLAQRLLPTVLADLWEHAGAFDPERESATDWIFGRVRQRARGLLAAAPDHPAAGLPHPRPAEPPPAPVQDPSLPGRQGLRRPTVPRAGEPDPRAGWRQAGVLAAALVAGGGMALAGIMALELLLAAAPGPASTAPAALAADARHDQGPDARPLQRLPGVSAEGGEGVPTAATARPTG